MADQRTMLASATVPTGKWQVPVFIGGLLSLAVAALVRFPHVEHAPDWTTDLASARALLERVPPEAARARALAERVYRAAPPASADKAQAAFLFGTAVISDASHGPEHAWKQARLLLEEAESLGVPAADRPRLAYALAQALSQTDGDAARIIDNLHRACPDSGETRPEALVMLATACLRLPKPDVNAALAANQQLLSLPIADVAVLAPARVMRAELLLLQSRRAEARAALADVTARAPRDVYVHARNLRARLAQEDGVWGEAATLWQEIAADSATRASDKTYALLQLGNCESALGRHAEGRAHWREAAAREGNDALAAAWRLAEAAALAREGHEARSACLQALAKGLPGAQPGGFDLAQARKTCESILELPSVRSDYGLSREFLSAYGKIAVPGRTDELWAQILEELAGMPREGTRGSAAENGKIVAHSAEAARAWTIAAEAAHGQPAEIDRLWHAVQCFRLAGQPDRAINVLDRILASKLAADRAAEAWYLLGSFKQLAGRPSEAVTAFEQCIQLDRARAFAYRARFQLGEIALARGRHDEAEQLFRQNLSLMGADPDPEAHAETLLALAGLLYRRGDYRLASVHLQKSLDRYPGNPRALSARHVLADCYRRLADEQRRIAETAGAASEDGRKYARDQYRLWLGLAASNYSRLREELLAHGRKSPLSATDAAVLYEADFAEIECRFNLGQYAQAVELAQTLADAHRDTAESLLAYKQLLRCYWAMGLAETDAAKKADLAVKAKATLALARLRLSELSDSAFSASISSAHDRHWWEQWLDWAARQW